jgi:hypothetical protein
MVQHGFSTPVAVVDNYPSPDIEPFISVSSTFYPQLSQTAFTNKKVAPHEATFLFEIQ